MKRILCWILKHRPMLAYPMGFPPGVVICARCRKVIDPFWVKH